MAKVKSRKNCKNKKTKKTAKSHNLKCDLKVPADSKSFRQYFFGILETEKVEKTGKIDEVDTPEKEKQKLRKEVEKFYDDRKADVENLAIGNRKSIPKWMRKYYATNVKLPIVKFEEIGTLTKNNLLVSYLKDPSKCKIGKVFIELPFANPEDIVDLVSDVKLVDKSKLYDYTPEELFKFLLSDKKSLGKRKIEASPVKQKSKSKSKSKSKLLETLIGSESSDTSASSSDSEVPLKKKTKQ